MASVMTAAEIRLLLLEPIWGSGPIVSKNVDGSGKLVAGTAVAELTVGITLVNISWGSGGLVKALGALMPAV